MGKKIRCVGQYRNEAAGLAYEVGGVYEVSSSVWRFLMADAPGCFEEYVAPAPEVKRAKAKTRQVKRPPMNKASST